MTCLSKLARSAALGLAFLALAGAPPLAAQLPVECDQTTWAASAPTPAAVANYCANNPGVNCSLEITDWNLPATPKSPDIQLGAPIGSLEDRTFDADITGNRLFNKVYVKLRNDGVGPAPASQVSVTLHVKEGNVPATPPVDGTWTMIGSYPMTIPAVGSQGALFPSLTHVQDGSRPVCWTLPVADFTPPERFTLAATVNWPQDDDTTNNVAFSFYDLTDLSRPAKLGLALDLSGSMAGVKLNQAQDKAGMFVNLIEDGDRIAVFGFATDNVANTSFNSTYISKPLGTPVNRTLAETNVISPNQVLATPPAPAPDPRDVIAAQINAQGAHNCTPVGQGLLRAREAVNAPGAPLEAQKAIVIFSDGLQNIPPFINTTSTTCFGATPHPTIDGEGTFGDEGIEIYSVFWGSSIGYGYNTLNDIQNQTGGDLLFASATEIELAEAYLSIRGLVDDLLYYDPDGFTSAQQPAQFEVVFDSGASHATVAVAWPWDNGETRLQVLCREKGAADWRDCDPDPAGTGEVATTAFRRGARDEAYRVFRFEPGLDTTWEFQVLPRSEENQVSFVAAVYSPVREAQIFPSLDNDTFTAGDPLPIRAKLSRNGAPVTGATVSAAVQTPTRRFGNLLRRYRDRFRMPAPGDSQALAIVSQLQGFLAQDEGSDQIYTYADAQVAMRDDGQGGDRVAGDGIYTGVLPGSATQIAGDYRVTITARATLASGRTIQRIARLSALAAVGPADPARSEVLLTPIADPQGVQNAVAVTVLAADRFGNATFPYAPTDLFQVTAVDATLQGGLADNLDSTYTQVVAFDDAAADPTVSVSVGTVELERDKSLRPGVKPAGRPWSLSVHAGLAEPHGRLARFFDGGPSLGLDIEYAFDDDLAVKLELVRDEFDRKSGGGSEEMLNLSVYLQYRHVGGTWTPYVEAGVGFYDFVSSAAAGFSLGAGLRRPVAPDWSFDLNLQGHRVGGSLDVAFSRIRAGLIYNF